MCDNTVMDFEAIHRLIKRGDSIAIRRELDDGRDPNLVNKYFWTLLMLAALVGNTKIGELLISCGADVSKINTHGDSALSLAAGKGHLPFVKLLMDHGAKTNVRPGRRSLSYYMTITGLSKKKREMILDFIKGKSVESP